MCGIWRSPPGDDYNRRCFGGKQAGIKLELIIQPLDYLGRYCDCSCGGTVAIDLTAPNVLETLLHEKACEPQSLLPDNRRRSRYYK